MGTLGMSYNRLPHHLKACFLYLGVFPEDFEIPVQKLIWLWVAEGFIHKSGERSLEDIAEDYLMHLLDRSLVKVARKGLSGRIKSCRIHDLLRDLCLREAMEDKFAPKIYRYGQITSTSFDSSRNKQFDRNILHHAFCHLSSEPCTPPIYPFSCFAFGSCELVQEGPLISYESFKLVRVLDLLSICFLIFPSNIVQLRYLRYLAVQAKEGSPPASISNLRNLEILIISSTMNVIVPQSTWRLAHLRHIQFRYGENLIVDPSSEEVAPHDGQPFLLGNLQTMSQVCPSRGCGKMLARTRNLIKLGLCGPLISDSRTLMFPDLSSTNHLETLKLLNTCNQLKSTISCNPIKFPKKLKRLTLSGTCLEWSELWAIGMLPNLEVLKLKLHACIGRRWETAEGFHQLKFLKIQDVELVQCDASNTHFPCLQHLVLHRCSQLEEIASGLGNIPTLDLIEVSWCSQSAADSATAIREEQESTGNDYLKILLTMQHEDLH